MKLRFKASYLSIKQFESIDLPLFTLFTGLNGSGKTHVLRAIEEGHIVIEGISPNKIQFFNYSNFKANQNSLERQQIKLQTEEAWENLLTSDNLLKQSKIYYSQCFSDNSNYDLQIKMSLSIRRFSLF